MESKKDNSLLSYYGFTKAEQKEYPVITRILKQLTSERIKKELREVQKTKLPPELQRWVREYEKIGERNDFVFKWCYKINTKWFLIDVPMRHHQSLIKVKTLFNIFIVLLDDISEKREKGKLLNELLKIPFNEECIVLQKLSQKEKQYLRFSTKVWHQIEKEIKQYPQYQKIKDIFELDVFQFLNAVRYGFFISKNPYLMNEIEYWTYFPQSMQIIIDVDLDLMCTSKFDFREIGKFREIILYTQRMARVGNWITTWEREAKNNDFTSQVFPYTLTNNIISVEELRNRNKDKMIEKIKISSAENYLLKQWEKYYKKNKKMDIKIKTINIKKILQKFEHLLFMHLISYGHK